MDFPRLIVDENGEVLVTLMRARREFSTYVRKDPAKDGFGAGLSVLRYLRSHVLPLDARLASVGVYPSSNLHAAYHALFDHADDGVIVEVGQTTVPDLSIGLRGTPGC